jgi:hypothetical protein
LKIGATTVMATNKETVRKVNSQEMAGFKACQLDRQET